MPSEWTLAQVDQRTFGQQQGRLLDDLNRPDLISQAPQYLQDAIRYFQRRPFFFTETDNQACPAWAASTIYTQGATIQMPVAGTQYAFVALNAGTSGAVAPTFPATLFTPTGTPFFPPPTVGTAGTVVDNAGVNQIIWGNNGPFTQGVTTGLSTVYNINQVQMPIEIVSIKKIEVTWSGNLRIAMVPQSYDWIRSMDVVRPAPASYPAWYAFYQQQVYLWPYPVGQFPITLSYIGPPPLAKLPNDTNVWTTKAEACIRNYAAGLMQRLVIHDEQAAQQAFMQAELEYVELVSQHVRLDQNAGITASEW